MYYPRIRRTISRRPASPRKVAIAISPPPFELEFPALPFALPLWLMSVELLPLAVVLAPLPLLALPEPLLLAAPAELPVEPWLAAAPCSVELWELLELGELLCEELVPAGLVAEEEDDA